MSVSVLWTIGAGMLWVVPTGLLASSYLARRDELLPDDVAAVGITTGLAALLVGPAVLARLGVLSATSFWMAGAVLAVVALGVWLGGGRSHPARNWADWGWVALPLLLALVAAIPVLTTIVTRPDALPGSTPWYYWDLARQTAEAGGFPGTSVEFGRELPFLDDYPGFTAATSGVALASGRPELLFAAHLFRIIAAVGAGFGIWYLTRAYGASRLTATAAVFLLLATGIFATKLLSYRPEAAGYVFMLATPALTRRWLQLRQPVLLVAAAAGLAALGLVHGLAWIMGAILVLATVLAWSLLAPLPWNRKWAAAGLILVTMFGAWAVISGLTKGRLTEAGKLHSAPQISADGNDPTWQFILLISGDAQQSPPPSVSETALSSVNRGFFGLHPRGAVLAVVSHPLLFWALGGLALAALVVRAVRGHRGVREFLLVLLLVSLAVAAGTAFFAIGWDTYVPRRTWALRIVQLSVLVVPWLIVVAVARDKEGWLGAREWGALAGAVVIWALVAGDVVTAGSGQLPPRHALAAQKRLQLDGPVLANAYTEGYLATTLDAEGALDGRAPYTDARLLEDVNQTLGQTRDFFLDPLGSDLDIAAFDWVIAIREHWALGSSSVFLVDTPALRRHPDLRLVADHGSWLLFEVVP